MRSGHERVYQATEGVSATHQVGLVALGGELYRLHVGRVVARKRQRGGTSPRRVRRQQHQHSVFHILLVESGTAWCMLEDEVREIPGGRMLCIHPGQRHSFGLDIGPCTYSNLTFEVVSVRDDARWEGTLVDLLAAVKGTVLSPPHSYPILEAGGSLHRLLRDVDDIHGEVCRSEARGAHALLSYLLDIGELGFASVDASVGARLTALQAVRDLIRRSYNRRLDLDALAEEACLSRRSLTRRFREIYATSPIAYQLDLRTEASKLMLRTSHLQVQEIAEEVGFTDIYQFSKAFKQRTGMSPVAFRRSPVK